MSVLPRLTLSCVGVLAFWCVFDLVYVKAGQRYDSLAWGAMWCLAYLVLPVTLFAVLRRGTSREPWSLGKALLVALIASVVWGFIAIVILVNFHFAIGGRI